MVAFSQPERLILYQPRSNKSCSTVELHRDYRKRGDLRSHTLVVAEQATQLFVTNDLLIDGEWIIQLRPLPRERPIVQGLMWPQLVVIIEVRRDKIVEVLLAKDREEI